MSSPASAIRSFVALAYADELLEHPELLADYGRTFGVDDDVTLAIFAPGADGETIAAALGAHAEIDADLMLLAVPAEDAPALAERVDYVYSRRAPLQLFAELPHAGDPAELRRALGGGETEVAPSATPAPPEAPVSEHTTRSFVTLAYAAELLADPTLLGDYGRTFGAADDITLAIFAPGVDAAEVAEALADQTDVDADLELLAVEAGDARTVAASVDYVYSRRAPIAAFAELPHTGDPRELRSALTGEAPTEDSFVAPHILEAAPPWVAEELVDADVPGMITPEENRYYRWIGQHYTGEGAVVELGPWLGRSTLAIVAGLRRSAAFAGRKLHVYDDFVWRSDWMDGYYDQPDRPAHHGDFQPIYERYVAPVAGEIVTEKVKFADYAGNEQLPKLEWTGGPVEILYVDCGRTFEANEAWWQIFEPHLIPGRSLVIMQDWQLHKEQPPKWYNQTKEFTDSKGRALELVHELANGDIATFVYHGAPVATAAPAAPSRIADRLVSDGARFHEFKGEAISWHNGGVLALLEDLLQPGMRTLETGSGHSTVVFAASGCEHTAITPEVAEANGILAYCREQGYPEPRFLVGHSSNVLPTVKAELDVVYVDGAHAFPHPILDWWYASQLLKVGGLLIVDDTDITGCFLISQFMKVDQYWETVAANGNYAIYRKTGDYPHTNDYWSAQEFSKQKIQELPDLLRNVWPEKAPNAAPPAAVASAPVVAPSASVAAEPRDERPNYLLLTYDSCRYDVLTQAHTPVLDSYAEILPAQTPANFTYAAHQAFFVGMFPNALEPRPYHNRFVNQLIGLGKVGEIQVIDKACAHRVASDVNLIEGLAREGYQTVGTGAMNWFKQRSLTQWFEKFRFTGTDADAQIEFLRSEIDPSRPFFGFVNFGETHDPFDFDGKPDKCPIEVQSRLIEWPPAQNGVPVGRDSVAWEHQRRSAEFLDARLPRLFEGLPGNTIVILCGDHGEAFGEDGYWGHGINHPVVQQVPLAIFRLDRKAL